MATPLGHMAGKLIKLNWQQPKSVLLLFQRGQQQQQAMKMVTGLFFSEYITLVGECNFFCGR